MLSARQKAFCASYLQTGNAEAAALAAGYARPETGHRLLQKPELWPEWFAERRPAAVAEPSEVLEFYTALMRGECGGAEIKVSERLKGAENLSRIFGLFGAETVRPQPVCIVDNIPLPEAGHE